VTTEKRVGYALQKLRVPDIFISPLLFFSDRALIKDNYLELPLSLQKLI
jgi:hypothetical protein